MSTEEIVEAFGFGESGPDAIRDFLEYAYHHWRSPSYRYVLLLGDGTYDFKDYLGTGVMNRVPPVMIRTSHLWTASDPSYGAVNGEDSLPDVAVGRLPAANAEEIRIMVDKILAHELDLDSGRGRIVLVADNRDPAGDFERCAETLAEGVLRSYQPRKIYLGQLGALRAREALRNAFGEEASLMSYLGHGGIHLWADENLLHTEGVGSLPPASRFPLVLTMNCLNGYFHFPYFDALSEALVKAEGKGAIAVFSPSGLSENQPAEHYHRILFEELLGGAHPRLGDALLRAQESYASTGALPELLSLYHLFGDPALTLRVPR